MQTGNITLQVVEAVAGGAACSIEVDAVERLHNINVIRNLEIRNDRIAKLLNLNVLGIVLADRNGRVNDVRDDHHTVLDFLSEGLFVLLELGHLVGHSLYLGLDLLSLFLLTLGHQTADLLGLLVALCTQLVTAGLGCTVLRVKLDDLVNHRDLLVLELLLDVFLYRIRIGADKFDIQHCVYISFFIIYVLFFRVVRLCILRLLSLLQCSFDRLEQFADVLIKAILAAAHQTLLAVFRQHFVAGLAGIRGLLCRQGNADLRKVLIHLTLLHTLLGRTDYIGCRLLAVQRLADLIQCSVLYVILLLQIFHFLGCALCHGLLLCQL